jgi:hypothetical protein
MIGMHSYMHVHKNRYECKFAGRRPDSRDGEGGPRAGPALWRKFLSAEAECGRLDYEARVTFRVRIVPNCIVMAWLEKHHLPVVMGGVPYVSW